mmetsp:Transcript_8284/g.14032  ORF Transcript_8284/g.14032 Transcript_8284/m.14032 type:complete len:194 (-) Transcript_8284:950-1531(-)|eukprot:CAMPEP_0114430016 /NCGR_PEP_ID=MMETSP0103-20121206/9808_1 /TAXON_ID=37642 ORGANISM="Paraphysomonas imperforata, Strain PA2" /NCGR_SAMPLE_ID=MMETSP0103 /ASSEMBLY_ACC=CAM_ASM_000201 /LENGTH=193 /DNA_ID=CAMNT_0001599419 /DNA_START=108 /DNA_END=689 /DNA_ORIENTATION=+
MPSFDQLVLSSPIGFVSGCSSVNNKAEDYDSFVSTTSDVFLSLKRGEGSSGGNKTLDGSSSFHTTLDHVARSCLTAVPKVEPAVLASSLEMCTTLSDEAIRGIVAGYESISAVEVTPEEHTSHLGRLYDLQWKLGVSVSSSNCSNLSVPFVSMSYKVSDTNGQAKGYSMELPYPEFQEFLAKLKAIAEHMDSL